MSLSADRYVLQLQDIGERDVRDDDWYREKKEWTDDSVEIEAFRSAEKLYNNKSRDALGTRSSFGKIHSLFVLVRSRVRLIIVLYVTLQYFADLGVDN